MTERFPAYFLRYLYPQANFEGIQIRASLSEQRSFSFLTRKQAPALPNPFRQHIGPTRLEEEQAENYLDEENFFDSKKNDTNVKKRIKVLDKRKDKEEIDILQQYLDLKSDISLQKKVIKELKYDLLTALIVKYNNFNEEEIKHLVIIKKWYESLASHLNSEMQRISQQLTFKVVALAERYEQTLHEIDNQIDDLETKVAAHLKQMGY